MLSRRAYKPLCKSSALKALNGDWIALKQKLRLSVLPAHQRHEPTQIVQTWSSADGGKLFQIGLAVLIQYRRVTDSQPATRPPSQPASQTRCRSKYCAYCVVQVTRSSADADKPARRVWRSVNVTKHSTIPYVMYSFLLCNSNFVFKTRRFRDIRL